MLVDIWVQELVNALLNVSRLELGTFIIEPEVVDITGLANSVIDELKPQIEEKKLKFTKDYDKNLAKIKLDPKLIRIVFQNLLSNAVKYTCAKGKVNLEIRKSKSHVNIIVSDSGIGVPKKQQAKLFTKLFRADNVQEVDADGTGLGLYIIKSILEASGGDISFESTPGKGSIFTIQLPLSGMQSKTGTRSLS